MRVTGYVRGLMGLYTAGAARRRSADHRRQALGMHMLGQIRAAQDLDDMAAIWAELAERGTDVPSGVLLAAAQRQEQIEAAMDPVDVRRRAWLQALGERDDRERLRLFLVDE